jgi:hypothetical protein
MSNSSLPLSPVTVLWNLIDNHVHTDLTLLIGTLREQAVCPLINELEETIQARRIGDCTQKNFWAVSRDLSGELNELRYRESFCIPWAGLFIWVRDHGSLAFDLALRAVAEAKVERAVRKVTASG